MESKAQADRRRTPSRRAAATSSSRWPRSCRSRPSPTCSAYPRRTGSQLFVWTNQMTTDDPDSGIDPQAASTEVLMYAMGLAADRKANPRDDIVTKLLNADKDGRGLTDDEFGFFVIALAVAGNETTRNAITHGMNAFFDNPDQWDLWKRERPDTMVDEVIRWATPVTSFQRTALEDVELERRPDQGRPAGRPVLRERQPRRGRVRRPVHVRHHPLAQPAPGLRRARRALLHRRQPGPPRDQADLRGARRPVPRTSPAPATRPGSGRAGSTGSPTCRSVTPAEFRR